MDVKNAFLNAALDEVVFMKLPEGFDNGSGDILLLRKSLYGLKQSPRQWFHDIDGRVKSIGFRSTADPNLYLRRDCLLLLYVDDILFIPMVDTALHEVRGAFESWYAMTWLGEAKKFLGIVLEYEPDGSICLRACSFRAYVL